MSICGWIAIIVAVVAIYVMIAVHGAPRHAPLWKNPTKKKRSK